MSAFARGRMRKGNSERNSGSLWIYPSLVISKADRATSPRHFVVLHSDPRVIAVHCKNRKLEFVAICAHSPRSGAPIEIRKQWWDYLQKICEAAPNGTDKTILIDANARIHSSVPGIVGDLTESFPTPNEAVFVGFLASAGLCGYPKSLEASCCLHLGRRSHHFRSCCT